MSLFSLSTFIKAKPFMTQKSLAQKKRSAAMMTLLLTVAITGCSNNTTDTTDDSSNTSNAQAQENQAPIATDSDASVVQALQSNLQTSGIESTIISAIPTDMDDIYWVTAEGLPAFFTDKSGKHIIQGQIVAVGGAEPVDISSAHIANSAKQALAAVDKKDMVIFAATGATKSVVYAFTDADCGYCRKLHEEMSDINARGIEVRYLAWPRSQESVPKMEAIWCSQDRKVAMDQAKMGANVQAPSCDNPVADQMALGARLGVRGTPAIFTQSGQQVGGYLPANQLAQAVAAAN